MTSTKQHMHAVDKSFDPAKSNGYKLYLEVGTGGLKSLVLDPSSETYVGYEMFHFDEVVNEYALLEPIKKALKQSQLLSLEYKSVVVSFINNRSTLIPNAIFKPDQLKAYHQFNFSERDEDVYFEDRLIHLNAHHVYSVADYLTQPFKGMSNVTFSHAGSPFIEATLLTSRKEKALSAIWVNVMNDCFQLSVIKGQNLAFYNTFEYKSGEDFVYFLLFALDQLGIDNEEATVNLVGNITKNSVLYPLLNKYIKTLNFRKFEAPIKRSYIFEDVPEHSHYSLSNLYLCES